MRVIGHMPKVSVIIPTSNRPELLPRAIRSVLDQTFQDFEIITVDDGQVISAQEAVGQLNESRIRYIKNDRLLGGGGTRNKGASIATGEYLAFLDDDDEWLPFKLEEQVAGLDQHPEAVAAFTGVTLYDPEGILIRERLSGMSGLVDIFSATLLHPFIWTSAIVVRAKVFRAIGGFDQPLPKNQEWDLELRLAPRGPFFAINKAGVRINVLPDDAHMGGKKNIANIIRGHEMLLEKHAAAYREHPRALGRVSFILAGLYREHGEFKKMRNSMRTAWLAQPFNFAYARHYLLSLLGEPAYLALWRRFQQ